MKYQITSLGIRFTKHRAKAQTPFERLFEIFKELITHTSGDFDEAIDWLRELDVDYQLTDEDYTIDDFIEDLLKKSFIQPKGNGAGGKEMEWRSRPRLKNYCVNMPSSKSLGN